MSLCQRHRRSLIAIMGGALTISLLGACSAESLTEFGLEKVIEAQADGDVDIDFSDGGLTVSTNEGELDISFDEEDGVGALVFNSEEGSGTVTFDEDGTIEYDTDQGSGTVTGQDGAINIDDDENGTVTITGTADGTGTMTSDSMQANFGLGTPPEGWPNQIGVPATVDAEQTSYSRIEQGSEIILTGTFSHAPDENFAAAVIDRLTNAGWSSDMVAEQDGGVFAQFSNGDRTALVISDGASMTSITIQL